jgi:hypothetical protein
MYIAVLGWTCCLKCKIVGQCFGFFKADNNWLFWNIHYISHRFLNIAFTASPSVCICSDDTFYVFMVEDILYVKKQRIKLHVTYYICIYIYKIVKVKELVCILSNRKRKTDSMASFCVLHVYLMNWTFVAWMSTHECSGKRRTMIYIFLC